MPIAHQPAQTRGWGQQWGKGKGLKILRRDLRGAWVFEGGGRQNHPRNRKWKTTYRNNEHRGGLVAYIPACRLGSAGGRDQREWHGKTQGSLGQCKVWRKGGREERETRKWANMKNPTEIRKKTHLVLGSQWPLWKNRTENRTERTEECALHQTPGPDMNTNSKTVSRHNDWKVRHYDIMSSISTAGETSPKSNHKVDDNGNKTPNLIVSNVHPGIWKIPWIRNTKVM